MSEAPRHRVVPKRRTRLGFAITTIHWKSVPGYQIEMISHGMDANSKRVELEIDWSVTRGRPVYPEFSRDMHVASEPLPYYPELPLILCWDMPGTPACAVTQLNPFGQWQIFPSLQANAKESVGVYEFGQRVADHLLEKYAAPNEITVEELSLVHIGDPAGNYKPPRTGMRRSETRAAFEVLRAGSRLYVGEQDGVERYEERAGWGWVVVAGAVDLTTRLEAVKTRLKALVGSGLPAMIVDPRAEPIIQALNGGYHYKENSDGSYGREPDKNHSSHIVNSLEYGATRLHSRPVPRRRVEDEDGEQAPRHISMAAGRDRF